jgi:MSHA biogenesis protein MshN
LIGLLLNAKRTDDAMSRAKEGLALDSSQTSLAIILARLQVDKGDLQDAIDTLQRSMSAGAANAEYQAFYAALMQRSANHKEAVEHYAAALRLSPQNGVWWMGMGISLQAEGRTDEAKDAYLRAKSSGALSPALATFVDQRLNQLAH